MRVKILTITQLKVGKTTFATQIPNSLLLAFEKGYQALPSVYAQDIVTWADFQRVVLQLRKEEVQDKFKTIVIDTADIAWELCEQYICSRHGVESLGDVAWGKAYKEASDEFAKQMRKISMLGYGIVFISHAEAHMENVDPKADKDDDEAAKKEVVKPSLNKRPYKIINGMVDLIGYIGIEYNEDGTSERYIYTRETPNIIAGNRFKYLPSKIPFSYESLVNELADATEMAAEKAGVTPSDEEVVGVQVNPNASSYEELEDAAQKIWKAAIAQSQDNAVKIIDLVEKVFGTRMKLSDIKRNQVDLYEVLVQELISAYGELITEE